MANKLTLDDRVMQAQQQLQLMTSPQVPISGPNADYSTNGQPGTTMLPAIEVDEPGGGGMPSVTSPAEALSQGPDRLGPTNGYTPDNPNSLPEATPVDNTAQLLAQKKQQALEALKAEGFNGYTPDISDAQQWDTDQQSMMGKAITDIGAGFNISLAKILSLPRETIDRGLALLGLDYMTVGSPSQRTIDVLNRMGIPAYEVENLANKIGRGALPALATWTAMQVAAPSMAAKQGVGTVSYLSREIGQWTLKHPIVGLWLGQAAQAGGETATHVTGSENPLVRFGGELAGGVAPGTAKFLAGKIPFAKSAVGGTASLVGKGVNAISDALPTDLGNAIKQYNPFYKQPVAAASSEPLINQNFDPNRIQTFAKDQIYGAQSKQDTAIENAINSIPTSGTPAQVQSRTHDLLQNAEKISKRIVSGFWERVPLKTRIPVSDVRRDTIRMRSDLVDNDNTRPDDMISKVIQATSPTRNPDGTMRAAMPTVTKMRDLQSQIGTAITEERAKDAPREGFVRNLARLSEIIDDGIATQLPNDTSIEQARQMSKRHNDLFSRGPINDILSKRRTGDFRVPQADSIDTLLQKTDGLAALKAVQEGVSSYPRIPTNKFQPRGYYNNPNAVTSQEKDQLDQLVKSAQDSIRAGFREAADQGPQKAVAYSQKNEDAIKALGNVAGDLAFAAQKVSTALAEKKQLAASALARFAETSPDKAVANIFAQKDPAGTARQLMLTFRGDPEALEGLRNEVLKKFIYDTGKTNPNVMQKMMNDPRYGNLMEATLSVDQNARLNKMINTAVRLGVEDETSFKQALAYPARTFGRIVGAKIGRMLNTGTIQTPGIISKAVGDWVERRFGTTVPSDMLAQAVLDPNWESLLYSRLPTTTRDMKAAAVKYRRIFSGINSAQQATMNKLSKENDNEQ